MQVLCLYGPRKSKPRLKSELRKQQYTVTLFDRKHLAHVIVLLANPKIYVLLYSFCFFFLIFFFFNLGQFPSRSPRGLLFGGAIYRRVFCVTSFGGLIFGGAYFRIFMVSSSWNQWNVPPFWSHYRNNSTSSPGLLGERFNNLAILLHDWRHF